MTTFRTATLAALHRLGRYAKTDMVYLVSGGFWLTVGQIFVSVSAFFIAVTYANLLSVEVYGTYKFVIAIAAVMSVFTLPGLSSAVVRSVARGKYGSIIPATWLRIYGGLFGALCTLIIAGYYYFQGNTLLALSCVIIAIFLPIFDTFNSVTPYLHARGEFKRDAIYSTIIRALTSILLIIAAFLTRDLLLLLVLYFASHSILRLFLYWWVLLREPPHGEKDPGIMRYGIHLSAMNAFSVIATQLDKILLFHYLGAVEVAIYSIATALPENLKGFVRNSAALVAPKYSRILPVDVPRLLPGLWQKLTLFTLAILAFTVCYIFAAPIFFSLLFPEYLESVAFSQVYALVLVTSAVVLPASLLQYQVRTKEMYLLNVVNYTSQIALLFILVPWYGIWGALWARVASAALYEVFTIGLVMYIYRTKRTTPS